MLVHKRTMGVLTWVWTGESRTERDGKVVPVLRPARLADFPELDPAEWWEVPGGTLARKILKFYPCCAPVTEGGELVDVIPEHDPDREAQERREQRRQEAERRGYQQARRVRPVGLMTFLN